MTPLDDGRGNRGRPMECIDCGKTVIRRSPSQRYCPECSGSRDTTRKREWAANSGHKTPPNPAKRAERKSETVAAGAARSLAARAGIAWNASDPVGWHTAQRVAVPFDWSASKNAIWRTGRGGHIYARREAVAWKEALVLALRRGDHRWFQGRLWIDIFVEKPNQRGDAVNVIDAVCDAVKVATGVDDRWYSITRLDWSIVKINPRIIVGVRQAIAEDHGVCSHCGRDLPLAASFGSNAATKSGYARVCRDCARKPKPHPASHTDERTAA